MWIRKFERDQNKGVTSPVPTQMLSTEEFIPRPQNDRQKHVEHLIGEMSEQKAKKLALPCSPVDSPVAALYGGPDVLIHVKEIGGIVRGLDGRQALVVVPIARFDALLALLFHHEIHVRAAR